MTMVEKANVVDGPAVDGPKVDEGSDKGTSCPNCGEPRSGPGNCPHCGLP
jgi:hypothetical protein